MNLNDDFTPIRGNSLNFWCDGWIEFGQTNVPGQCGAVRAIEADDIGSPGYLTNHPAGVHRPRFTSLARTASGVSLTWQTRVSKRYELQFKPALTNVNWTSLSQHTATGLSLMTLDPSATNAGPRFYRLEVLPDPP